MTEAPPPAVARSFRPLRHKIGYGFFVILALALFAAFVTIYPRWFVRYQHGKPRYAAERALEDLDARRNDLARGEIEILLADRPLARVGLLGRPVDELWEGQVLRNRSMVYERLAARLLDARLPDQAEAVGWKALLEFHLASRAVEDLVPWTLLFNIQAVREEWPSAFESARILSAHGMKSIPQPADMQPVPYEVDSNLFEGISRNLPSSVTSGLQLYSSADSPPEFQKAAALLLEGGKQTPLPGLRRQLVIAAHRALARGGAFDQARHVLKQAWGRDPSTLDPLWNASPGASIATVDGLDLSLLEIFWRDRPSSSSVTLMDFLNGLAADPRIRLVDFADLKRVEIGYFLPQNTFTLNADRSVSLNQGVAAALEFETAAPTRRLLLAFEAQPVLGVYPILLLKIDDRPYWPLYCDSERPDLVGIDCDVPAGHHRIELIYLNDASFKLKNVEENRNLTLQRLILISGG